MRCLLDMDGVLVDFVGGMVKAHGLPANPYDDPRWHGEYDMAKSFGVSLTKLWRPATRDFWARLVAPKMAIKPFEGDEVPEPSLEAAVRGTWNNCD